MILSTSNKTKMTAIIAIVLLMASALMLTATPLMAQLGEEDYGGHGSGEGGLVGIPGDIPPGETPFVEIDTTAHLSFRPNPVGEGQEFLVNLWTTPGLYSGRYHPDYIVTITKPSGDVDTVTIDSYNADATAWFPYVADEVGDWTLRFDFQGTYFPNGTYIGIGVFGGGPTELESAYYRPSTSGDLTLTVLADYEVQSWPEPGIIDDYWERPVHVEHRDWWPAIGWWPATGYSGVIDNQWEERYPDTNIYWSQRHKFTPWVQGPNSAHIIWKRQEGLGGMIGGMTGPYGNTAGGGLGGTLSEPTIIYAGRAYDSYQKPGPDGTMMFRCYDLRTGEVYWEQPAVTTTTLLFGIFPVTNTLVPDIVELTPPSFEEVPGAEAAGTYSVSLMTISDGRLYKWDPWTGEMTVNATLDPISSATFYRNSEGRDTEAMALSVQNIGTQAEPNYRLINWSTLGSSNNFESRVLTNTSYARSSLPSLIDWEAGYGATVSGRYVEQVITGQVVTGYDLYTGEELWQNDVIGEPYYSGSCSIADHGKVAIFSANGYYVAYNLDDGSQAWVGEKMDYPWADAGFGAYSAMSAYGMLYRESMDGIYAYNWTNGDIEWKYEARARSPYETPFTARNEYTVMPFYSFGVGGIIADGKFYTWNYEHTESWPVTRGWTLHAIDVFTGEAVWTMLGAQIPYAIADGYLIAGNTYDGYIYAYGKGETETTVSGPKSAVPSGTAVTITGSVLDMSPAQPGTPAVSTDSMPLQMEYLHMDMPIDGIWHNETIDGVPVTLTAIHEDGVTVDNMVATTSGYTGTFGASWTPTKEGLYEVIASFETTEAYGSSVASTWVTVGPAPSSDTGPDVEPDGAHPIFSTEAVIVIAVVVIAALAIIAYLVMRKPNK